MTALTVRPPPQVCRGAGSRLRHLAGDALRRLGVRHPHDLVVWLQSLGRGPYWRVPVLAYHRVEPPSGRPGSAGYFVAPDAFAEQVAALAAEGYRSVLASELCEAVAGLRTLPERALVLTFDDGFASVAEHVPGVLEAHGFRATVFLIAGRSGPSAPSYLSEREIRRLAALPSFEFGSHTCGHQPLTALSPIERERELSESKRIIEGLTGRACSVFCYPFGALDRSAERAVRAAGYVGAFCSLQGTLHAPASRYRLARLNAAADGAAAS